MKSKQVKYIYVKSRAKVQETPYILKEGLKNIKRIEKLFTFNFQGKYIRLLS